MYGVYFNNVSWRQYQQETGTQIKEFGHYYSKIYLVIQEDVPFLIASGLMYLYFFFFEVSIYDVKPQFFIDKVLLS